MPERILSVVAKASFQNSPRCQVVLIRGSHNLQTDYNPQGPREFNYGATIPKSASGIAVFVEEVIRQCHHRFTFLATSIRLTAGMNSRQMSPTRSWILEDAGFGKDGKGTSAGSTAILTWDRSAGAVEIVAEPWLKRMRMKSWQHVLPDASIEGSR